MPNGSLQPDPTPDFIHWLRGSRGGSRDTVNSRLAATLRDYNITTASIVVSREGDTETTTETLPRMDNYRLRKLRADLVSDRFLADAGWPANGTLGFSDDWKKELI